MIPNTDAKQLTLNDDGHIFWQNDPSNPLPGVAVARVVKGSSALSPVIELLPELPLVGEAKDVAIAQLGAWLTGYIARVLEPLVKLKMEIDGTPDPVRVICDRVYDGLGIVPRTDVMDQIEKLDTETRKTLRGRHVRLGPILVFVPDLNKPAAVRLRALLWSLWNDRALPAPTPRDGAVSQVVDAASADPAFYRAIGYPLYANRVIRIDMLDRVMNAVYENVKDNKFMATHQMAEWLGAPVADLYAVLESMGHKKISDPADVKVVESIEAKIPETESVPLVATESVVIETVPAPAETTVIESTDTVSEATVTGTETGTSAEISTAAGAIKKPELATFRVWWPRKGGAKADGARAQYPRGPKKPYTPRVAASAIDGTTPLDAGVDGVSTGDNEKPARRSFGNRPPRGDKPGSNNNAQGDDRAFGDRKFGARSGGGDKPGLPREGRNVGGRFGGRDQMTFGGNAKSKGKEKLTRTDKNLRMMAATSAPAAVSKPDDSPFAVLGTLKF